MLTPDPNLVHAQERSSGKPTSLISNMLKRMRTAVDENYTEKLSWSAVKQDSVKVRFPSSCLNCLSA